MRPRKVKDLVKALTKKGFSELSSKQKSHHSFFYFMSEGKKTGVYTYFSHGSSEYSTYLMGQLKKQLKFSNVHDAEDFFDCPFTKEKYEEMLKKDKHI